MPTAEQYRAQATEFRELRQAARSPSEARQYQILEQSFVTLADNAQWMVDNRDKTNCQEAADSLYDDVLRPGRDVCQGKNAPGSFAAADPTSSSEVLTKIHQLFDDAGSKGGLLQTATLRGRLTRFLKKHKDDDFVE
jgi:hypothetical protein